MINKNKDKDFVILSHDELQEKIDKFNKTKDWNILDGVPFQQYTTIFKQLKTN